MGNFTLAQSISIAWNSTRTLVLSICTVSNTYILGENDSTISLYDDFMIREFSVPC